MTTNPTKIFNPVPLSKIGQCYYLASPAQIWACLSSSQHPQSEEVLTINHHGEPYWPLPNFGQGSDFKSDPYDLLVYQTSYIHNNLPRLFCPDVLAVLTLPNFGRGSITTINRYDTSSIGPIFCAYKYFRYTLSFRVCIYARNKWLIYLNFHHWRKFFIHSQCEIGRTYSAFEMRNPDNKGLISALPCNVPAFMIDISAKPRVAF